MDARQMVSVQVLKSFLDAFSRHDLARKGWAPPASHSTTASPGRPVIRCVLICPVPGSNTAASDSLAWTSTPTHRILSKVGVSSSIDAVIGRGCNLRPTPVRARLCARRRPLFHLSLPPAHMVCTKRTAAQMS